MHRVAGAQAVQSREEKVKRSIRKFVCWMLSLTLPLGILAGCGGGGGGGTNVADSCANLAGVALPVPKAVIKSVALKAATSSLPEHCQVDGVVKPTRLIGDMAYGAAQLLAWMVNEKSIEPHVPVWDKTQRSDDMLSSSEFGWNDEANEYLCPRGEPWTVAMDREGALCDALPRSEAASAWLNREEVTRLLQALPPHQRQPARFALATGLRQANVLRLQWLDVDRGRRTAWVHADEAKGGEAIGVPLNDEVVAVLRDEQGKHQTRVFTFRRRPLGQANTRSRRNALKRAGIETFRWHDLRHVWATWHVIAGTTIAELQELGAWKSDLMVKRYAHFAPEQLRAAANRLATFSSTVSESATQEST